VDNEAHDDFMESWKNWVVDFTLMDVWQWLPFFVVLEIMGSSNTMNGLCVLRIGVQEKGDFFLRIFNQTHKIGSWFGLSGWMMYLPTCLSGFIWGKFGEVFLSMRKGGRKRAYIRCLFCIAFVLRF